MRYPYVSNFFRFFGRGRIIGSRSRTVSNRYCIQRSHVISYVISWHHVSCRITIPRGTSIVIEALIGFIFAPSVKLQEANSIGHEPHEFSFIRYRLFAFREYSECQQCVLVINRSGSLRYDTSLSFSRFWPQAIFHHHLAWVLIYLGTPFPYLTEHSLLIFVPEFFDLCHETLIRSD